MWQILDFLLNSSDMMQLSEHKIINILHEYRAILMPY